jgi:hypothetical protein
MPIFPTKGDKPMRCLYRLLSAFSLAGSMMLVGCHNSDNAKSKGDPPAVQKAAPKTDQLDQADEIKAARDKLSPDDRKLVDAQEFCAVQTDSRLGEMGVPVKVMVKDQLVFLCCKSCQKKALADPAKTLASVEELKIKAAALKK